MSLNIFKCNKADSKLKLILKSDCFKYRKMVFNIHNKSNDDMNAMFDEIKSIIVKYENDQS
jgi:hypothetical protein